MKQLKEQHAVQIKALQESAAKKDAEITRLTKESDDLRAEIKTTRQEVMGLKSYNQSITAESENLRTQIASLLNKVPTQQAEQQPINFLASLLDHASSAKLPFVKDIKDKLRNLEQRMGKKVNEHLGFDGVLKDFGEVYVKYSDNPKEHG